ncbi:exonuclease domain-containing protein [Noviherbaspirillum sp. CPCC 100848]|uniref:DNA-directed DNA polymerase n=1 Tax=Noviherbaspirillum album TaxID=3080276 RepID=A0ABU6J6D1_9BURK|nr:exonuclease domain-containing protein [Noviherbaspirillum sp. CPCC 100848]MEC4718900.1 exonuclease domain-containing protein [Noviherbaspirillum sp. CPCC 100848]
MKERRYPRLAFVDLETTGGSAGTDRITEVGIVEVDEQGVREWSSLVNPDMPIPEFIQSLTNISDEMVQRAPRFAELADEIEARLADRVFIAHNARFDFGFLRSEFRRIGRDFHPPVLCTVRLSRKLYPEFERHNLDTLAVRHGLHVTERHRALGDAQLIWQFWQKIHEAHAADTVDEAIEKLLNRPVALPHGEALHIEDMPDTPGVYLFYGEHGVPLYVGRADHLYRRVQAHFHAGRMPAREQQMMSQVRRVDWMPTSGELGSLLLEARMVRQLQPAFNHVAQDAQTCAWRLAMRKGVLQPVLITTDDLFFGVDLDLYGLFASRRKACDALRAVANAYQLCPRLLGLEKTRGNKDGAAGEGQCKDACTCAAGSNLDVHNQRLRAALQGMRVQPWPYTGAIAIRENTELHVIDCWSYLGSVGSEIGAFELLQKGRGQFERQVYHIVRKWLSKVGVDIVNL